jgi:S-adenosylmethionine hydrolase
VAAHVANGLAAAELGDPIGDYLRLGFSNPARTGEKTWAGTILKADHFGNLITNFDSKSWQRLAVDAFEMRIGGGGVSRMALNYAQMATGELFVIAGSTGFLEISVNRGNAGEMAQAQSGDVLELRLL